MWLLAARETGFNSHISFNPLKNEEGCRKGEGNYIYSEKKGITLTQFSAHPSDNVSVKTPTLN